MENKQKYYRTPWKIDQEGVIHLEFPIELFLHISDEDWINYKNGIIKACNDKMRQNNGK